MKIAIIDDEQNAREILVKILLNYIDSNYEISQFDSVKTAKTGFNNNQFDIVFLDIDLRDGNGFELLDLLNTKRFKVIFVTAYSEFAIKAFKYSAFEYLLKPISIDDIKFVFKKLNELKPLSSIQNELFNTFSEKNEITSLLLHSQNGFEVILFDGIIKVESSKSYTIFYLKDGNKKVSSKNLGYYEEILPKNKFIRIHNSAIINMDYFSKYNQDGIIELKNSLMLKVSKRKKTIFVKFMNNFYKNRI